MPGSAAATSGGPPTRAAALRSPSQLLGVALPLALLGHFLEGAVGRLGTRLKHTDRAALMQHRRAAGADQQRKYVDGGDLTLPSYPAVADADYDDETWADTESDFTEVQESPDHMASDVEFEDEDPTPRNISGLLKIGKAADEQDVSFYNVYWGQGDQKLQAQAGLPPSAADYNQFLLQSIPRNGYNLEYDVQSYDEALQRASGVFVPYGATHFVVFTANAEGAEMDQGVAVPISDLSSQWLCEQYDPGAAPGQPQLVPCPSKLRQLQIRQRNNAQTTFTSELAGALGLPEAREKSYVGFL